MRYWPNLTGGHCSSMESCVITGPGIALGVDKWVERPSSATPFAVRGDGKQGGSGRRLIVVASMKILMER